MTTARMIGFAILLASTGALAQTALTHIFSDPHVQPGPTEPNRYVLSLLWTGCGGWTPDTLTVTTAGNAVTVTQQISHSGLCGAGGRVRFDLGTFPPGSYTLVYQAVHFVPAAGTYAPLTTQFTVGGPPIATPALGPLGLAILMLAILATGTLARRMPTQSRQN